MYKPFFWFKFCWQFNFFPLPDLSSWVFPSALVNVIAVFSCLVVLLKSLGGVKSVLAKINLYDLLGCSIFRLLPALWEMQQAEPSFLCRIINSVAFPVHMLQVRQNRELYLCLLHPSWKWGSARWRHMLSLFPLDTFGHRCWTNTTCFRVWEVWRIPYLLSTSFRTEATLERYFRLPGSWED